MLRMMSMVCVLAFSGLATAAPLGLPDYAEGTVIAKTTGKPLVTFVGQEGRNVKGAVACTTPSLPGFPKACVVVSVWEGDRHVGRVYTEGAAAPAWASVAEFAEQVRVDHRASLRAPPAYVQPAVYYVPYGTSSCPSGRCPNAR